MEKTEIANKVKTAMAKSSKPGTLAGLKSQDVLTVLEAMKPQISMALPKHLTPDRVLSIATTVISQNPKLAECTAQSLVGAVMQASILGFRPTPVLGEVYFVPYKNKKKMPDGTEKWVKEVQVQIGYKGYISLARRSGEIDTLYAYAVRENDEFDYELGLDPKLVHKPAKESAGKLTYVYAVAKYKSGGFNFIVLTKDDVEKLRLRNPTQKTIPSQAWATDYEAMACAKAIKQLAKYMPLSDEMQNAVVTDEKIIPEEALTNDHSGIDVEMMQDPFEEAEIVKKEDEDQNNINVEEMPPEKLQDMMDFEAEKMKK